MVSSGNRARRARLLEASSGDTEHADRIAAELERRRRPRSIASVEEVVSRRHAEERERLGLPPLDRPLPPPSAPPPPVPPGVIQRGRGRRGPTTVDLVVAVVAGIVLWTLFVIAVVSILELLNA